MAGLWWQSSQYTLSEATENIGEIYGSIANGLPGLGYTGVQRSASDIHGFKDNDTLAVTYLYIGGSTFWQVIACASDDTSRALAHINEVHNMINNFHFL